MKAWAGRLLFGAVFLFLLMDSVTHVVAHFIAILPVAEASDRLGLPQALTLWLGVIVLACLALALVRRLRILAAVLLTGYLGGAVAIHLRAGSSAFEVTFPVIVGALLWLGLWLLDTRVAQMIR